MGSLVSCKPYELIRGFRSIRKNRKKLFPTSIASVRGLRLVMPWSYDIALSLKAIG